MPDRWSVERFEELPAAVGGSHRLVAVVGAVDEGCADVAFEPVELEEQVLVVETERVGCEAFGCMVRCARFGTQSDLADVRRSARL